MSFTLELYRGNTDERTVAVTQTVGGAAKDLTGLVLKFIVKHNYAEADTAAVINKIITVSAPLTGIGVLTLEHDDLDIAPATYVCEIKLYKADGSYIKTLDSGVLTVKNVVLLEV